MSVELGLGVGVMVAFRGRGASGVGVVGGVSADDVPVVGVVHDPAGRICRAERTVQGRVHDMHPVGVHRWPSRCAWFAVGNAVGDGVLGWVGGDRADFVDLHQGVIARGVELLTAPLVDPVGTIDGATSVVRRQRHVRSVVLAPLVADERGGAIE